MDDKERDIKRGGSVLFEVDVSLQGSRKFIQYLVTMVTINKPGILLKCNEVVSIIAIINLDIAKM